MAYADQQMSSRKIVAIGLVVLLHAIIGYAFITGLAYSVVKKTMADLKTFDVEEAPPPPEEKPPPPPPEQKVEPPPLVTPPPIVRSPVVVAAPMQMVREAPPVVITPTAPPAPPPPPAPPAPKLASPASPRGNPGSWVTSDDYPSRALREEKEGVTGISFDIMPDGRVANCQVTSSSGTPELDQATCTNFVRRARYKAAVDDAGKPMQTSASQRVRWEIPKD
ncbi:MAG: energy transducer TonB [Sphingomonas bacterium]|jgi:protein TonB|nr:energy transducer TonB [Sphingomonas bacterium]MDB5688540.1 energy transducer TonB [Sphingomonas bacterium]